MDHRNGYRRPEQDIGDDGDDGPYHVYEPGDDNDITEISRSEYDRQQFQQAQHHYVPDNANPYAPDNTNPYEPHHDVDDYYYDPPGVVSGTPEPRQNQRPQQLQPPSPYSQTPAAPPPAASSRLRFPDPGLSYLDHGSTTATQDAPESYLLHDMTPPEPAPPHPNQNFPTFLHMSPNPRPRAPAAFDAVDTTYDSYTPAASTPTLQGTASPSLGPPQPTVTFDNDEIHNYYVGARLGRDQNNDPDDDDDDYNFMPFPVAPGDNYEVHSYMPNYRPDEDDETLLESSPQRPPPQGEITHMPVPQQYPDDNEIHQTTTEMPVIPPQQYIVAPSTQLMQPQGPQILGPPPVQQNPPPGLRPEDNAIMGLFHGGLVMDCPISMHLRRETRSYLESAHKASVAAAEMAGEELPPSMPKKLEEPREFQYMRYSALTCEPETFFSKFSLRQQWYEHTRQTEIFICVTLYNENEILLARTLQGIARNIEFFSRRKSSPWGVESWLKIVVCVVADGRNNLNPRSRMLMERLGVFQSDVSQNMVGDDEVKAHLYEYSTIIGVKDIKSTVSFKTMRSPIQYIFLVKEHNKGKINSHRWFFQGFSKVLRPKICMLIDAGTVPSDHAIYQIWSAFDRDPYVGGACGEIRAGLGKGWRKLLTNPLVAAQNFEYKMSNILDKPMESVFGFITVLPGAFSAYRYQALINVKGLEEMANDGLGEEGPLRKIPSEGAHEPMQDQTEELGAEAVRAYDPINTDPLLCDSPLGQYFKGETEKLRGKSAGIFTANMYLAEDRILCFELITKRDERWILRYVKSAHATTDVPEHLSELVLQRRRWLNGSFFAAIYSVSHMYHLSRSGHHLLRKLVLSLEFLYQTVSLIFSWFAIGNFFLVFYILTNSLSDSALNFSPGAALAQIFLWIYCACILSIFVLSFGNRPKGTQWFYILVVGFFAILMAYLLFASIYISVKSIIYTLCISGGHITISFVFRNPLFRDLVVSLMSTYALYIVSSLLFLDPWHIITSSLQYLLIAPSYINVLNVYAFCNIHDISWGTKSDDKTKKDLGVVKVKDNVIIELPVPQHISAIESSYVLALDTLSTPAPNEKVVVPENIKTTDWYALFRSTVVLAWIFSNLALVIVVLNVAGWNAFNSDSDSDSSSSKRAIADTALDMLLTKRDLVPSGINAVGDYIKAVAVAARQTTSTTDTSSCGSLGIGGTVRTEVYLTVILWSVAGLAAFRFVGAITYIILRLLGLH